VSGASSSRDLGGQTRFDVVRCLGEGGMGIVYEAIDRENGARVALKTLPNLTAEALLRFKNEFRALADLQHPNLVGLRELIEHAGHWFFTMELVEGTDFLRWVRHERRCPPSFAPTRAWRPRPGAPMRSSSPPSSRGGPPSSLRDSAPASGGPGYDEARLRSALAQLARGLIALHGAQKVHRDIKPSNVLVTPRGHVVILDFGVVTDTAGDGVWSHDMLVGTPTFMAPEQALGSPAGTQADWYSVGVLLFVALTGSPPFAGGGDTVMAHKQVETAPPPSSIVDVPPDLDALCRALLERDPLKRANGRAVLDALEVHDSAIPAAPDTFVGRPRELAALRDAYDAASRGAVTVIVDGESGVGKTSLVARFTESVRAEDPTALVLRGRCYERESVPFKAFDGVIDTLSSHLIVMAPEEVEAVLPEHVGLLAQAFPVLRRVHLIEELSAPEPAADPHHLRVRTFSALREMLSRVAARRRLALVIDDLQWTDADSLALLRDVCRPPDAPRALLIATVRHGSVIAPGRRSPLDFAIPGDVRHLHLEALPPEQARELAERLLGATGPLMVDVPAYDIARESGGHPLFIGELIRHARLAGGPSAGLRLDDALSRRIKRLDADARRVLEIVAVAGGPVTLELCARVVGLGVGDLAPRLSVLRGAQLLRTTGARAVDFVEPFHDRVRTATLSLVEPADARRWHGRIALAMEESETPELELLALHWREAGNGSYAAHYASAAAERASQAFAFHHAARLYRSVGELDPSRVAEVRPRLAEALARAGHGLEAGREYVVAADTARPEVALELRRRGAEQLLAAGDFEEGNAQLERVLDEVGMSYARSGGAALASLLWHRLRLRLRGLGHTLVPAERVTPEALQAIDVCWAAVLGFGITEAVRAADFQARHLLLALKHGEPTRLLRALGPEMILAAGQGKEARLHEVEAVAKGIVDHMGGALTQRAVLAAAVGIASYLLGDLATAHASLAEARPLLAEQLGEGARVAHDNCRIFMMSTLSWMGRLREWRDAYPELMTELGERQNVTMASNMKTGIHVFQWLARGEVETARRLAAEAVAPWPKDVTNQYFLDVWTRSQLALYEGDAAAALRAVDEGFTMLERGMFLRIAYVRCNLMDQRARASVALARTSPRRADLLRSASADAARLFAEPVRWAPAMGHAVRAAVALARSEGDEARDQLARAIEGFERTCLALHAAMARRRLGELDGAPDARAEAWCAAEGVTEPARLMGLIVPG